MAETQRAESGGGAVIRKFYNLLEKIGIRSNKDKVAHAVVGFAMAITIAALSAIPLLAIVVVTIAAVGKELYDRNIKKTKFDFFDLFATIAGGYAGMFIYGAFT